MTRERAGSSLFPGRCGQFYGRPWFRHHISADNSTFNTSRPAHVKQRSVGCGTSHPGWLPPPTFLRPVIFSAVGRCGGSSGLNRASIHSLTCVREVEAALSNGRCARKKDLTHEAFLMVPALEGLLRPLTRGRMCGLEAERWTCWTGG